VAAVARLPSGLDTVITHDASASASASAAAASNSNSAEASAAASAAAAPAVAPVEWPTAVYTPEGGALVAAFPPRATAAGVGYRETGDEEAEAKDAAAAAAAADATEAGGEGKFKAERDGGHGGGMSAAAFDVTLPGILLAAEAGGTALRASDGALHRFLCPHPEEGVAPVAAGGARRRTSYLSIEGRVYIVKDLWPVYAEQEQDATSVAAAEAVQGQGQEGQGEEGQGQDDEPRRKRLRRLLQRRQGQRAIGTEIELTEPFHRTITSDEAAAAGPGGSGGVRMLAALRPVFEPEGTSTGRQRAHLLGTLSPAGAVGCLAVNPLTHHVVLGYAASGAYEILGCERYRRGWENEEEDREATEATVVVVE
jgi:hypothetical protein